MNTGQAAPRWLDAREILADEGHARVEQAMLLDDVLGLADHLSATFTPVTNVPIKLNGQLAALVALESGLFGHLRSLRAAIADGRIQDVEALLRTLEEIRKRAIIAVDDPTVAERFAKNEEFGSASIDDMYEKVMRAKKRGRSEAQRSQARDVFGKQSSILHAQHAGLQFLADVRDGGTVITRSPVAGRLEDRGREAALHAVASAAFAAGYLVPKILEAHAIPDAEWHRRFNEVSEGLDLAARPYAARRLLREQHPEWSVEVDAIGQLRVNGDVVLIEDGDLAEAPPTEASEPTSHPVDAPPA
ncbi:MAG: hypothetical protein M3P18_07990 [Actinomycetota bacterium]|nr:hypothetical protein [Actinomycetota bacterium]